MPNINPQKKVIVRVWTSGYDKKFPGEDVGHISLEISAMPENIYVSAWPDMMVETPTETVPVKWVNCYNEDQRLESNRIPEITIHLYSLNLDAMIKEFRSEKEKMKGWCVLPALVSLIKDKNEEVEKKQEPAESISYHNCASLAFMLLKVGGIKLLVDQYKAPQKNFFSSTNPSKLCFNDLSASLANKSWISPESVIRVVTFAKLAEVILYPEIENNEYYQNVEETDLKKLKKLAAEKTNLGLATLSGQIELLKNAQLKK